MDNNISRGVGTVRRRPSRAISAALGLAATFGLLATGCGSTDPSASPGPTRLAFSQSDIADMPTAAGDVVLTVLGGDKDADGLGVEVDLAGIESLGTVTATLYEPFIEADIEVTGVPLDRVLASAGVTADDQLDITAVNMYKVDGSAEYLSQGGSLLVTRVDDKPISVADGGPIRLVYLDSDSTQAQNTNLWIWSIKTIEVK